MVDSKLVVFIKDGLNKEYTEDELRGILLESGWKPGEIDEGFTEINKEKEIFKQKTKNQTKPIKTKPTEKPTEIKPNPELLEYVKKALTAGYPKPQIRSALLAKDWPNEQINLIFAELGKHPIKKIVKPIIKKKPIVKPKESIFKREKKKEPEQNKKLTGKTMAFYAIAFILLSAIFSFTFMLFY